MTAVDVAQLPSFKSRQLLGGEPLATDDTSGTTRVRYTPSADLNNPNGTVLGGYLAAMIDDAAGLATWFGGGQRAFSTAQMSVNFLRTAKPADSLIAEVVVVGAGARQAFVDVKLVRERDGKLVATGTLVQTFLAQPPSGKVTSGKVT